MSLSLNESVAVGSPSRTESILSCFRQFLHARVSWHHGQSEAVQTLIRFLVRTVLPCTTLKLFLAAQSCFV